MVNCRCGDSRKAHKHYRKGTDCSQCSCAYYSRRALRFFWWPW